MVSKRKSAANRRNAQLSTGPKDTTILVTMLSHTVLRPSKPSFQRLTGLTPPGGSMRFWTGCDTNFARKGHWKRPSWIK